MRPLNKITLDTIKGSSLELVSSINSQTPLVSKKKDETKMINTVYTLKQYKLISLIKKYKSFTEVDGKYRFGIMTPSEDTRYHAVWAKNEQDAFKKSYEQWLEYQGGK